MIDKQDFLHDSLFCEWAYIINLTDNILEVYTGFQKEKPKGRYSEVAPSSDYNIPPYYAVGLLATYPLDKCPSEFSKEETPELINDNNE